MSNPYLEPMEAPVIAGDHNDDDAQVRESMVQTQPVPTLKDVPDTLAPDNPRRLPHAPDRIFGGVLTALTIPTLLAPMDERRKKLTLFFNPATAGDWIAIADDPSKLAYVLGSASQAVRLYATSPGTFDFGDYSGPLWVTPGQISTTFVLSWFAVARGEAK